MSRIVIAGSGSHCGKTSVTCGLLASLRNRGVNVSAFKTGPDYIDPCYLRSAGKCEVYNLDTWLMSREKVRELFVRGSSGKDIAIIEGAMGLHDGGEHSTAGIAKLLDAPVILVLDVKSLGESAAAIALGFREYDRNVNLAGVILNNAGSNYHVKIIADSLREKGIKFLGALRRNEGLRVPERHLGLALEHSGEKAERLRCAVEAGVDVEEVMRIAKSAPKIWAETRTYGARVSSLRVGVARDEAFMFYYPESLGILEELGAELVYFSPIHDERLPEADGYIFGGGFPEMFAGSLAENTSMLRSVRENERSVLAECGGMMYLCRNMTDLEGNVHAMAGIIPGDAVMTKRPALGYMEARALRKNILCDEGAVIRGHEFHYSRIEPEIPEEFCAFSLTRRNTNTSHLGGYAHGKILASYLHINLFGYPDLAERFMKTLTSSIV
ncbi:MAG: cobyrinate a,c-diamide synthase [Synergistaceae bacterium]|nr:cobyrinate a,c-diamide synthase [Synergistaceae bacterium]